MEALLRSVIDILGIGQESHDLGAVEMVLRVPIVYLVALAYIRLGEKRFMGRNTAFDLILAIMFGSIMGRAITGQSPFLPTIASGAALVAVHWAISFAAFHSTFFSKLAKGRGRILIKDGRIQRDEMRRGHIGEHDLLSALRGQGKIDDPADVRLAVLERSGKISVIPRKPEKQARVVDVRVGDGVQTVRIEIDGG